MTRSRLAVAALALLAAAGGGAWWWTRPPGPPVAVVFHVTGRVDGAMADRAVAMFESGDAPVLLVFDTPDGDDAAVRRMGEALSEAQGRGRTVAGFLAKQAKGAGGSLALACVPLYCEPKAELGAGRPWGGARPDLPEDEIRRRINGRANSWGTIAKNRGRDAYQATVLVTLHVVLDGRATLAHKLSDGTARSADDVKHRMGWR